MGKSGFGALRRVRFFMRARDFRLWYFSAATLYGIHIIFHYIYM